MADYYVNTASEGGDGTTTATSGAQAAFATVAAAQAALTGDQSDNRLLFNRGNTWREQFTVGAYGTSGHQFTIGAYGSGADPIINGANVITGWTRGTTVTELIANGTMEADSNWANQGSPTTNERSSTQAHGGTYSRRFISDAAYEGIRSDAFTTTNNMVLTYSLWVYPDSQYTNVHIVAGTAASYCVQRYINNLSANQWNNITGTCTDTTAGGAGARIRVESATTTQTIYVDDVSVTKSTNLDYWYKAGITTEPKAVYYNGTKLTHNDTATVNVGSNEWDWAADVLYINVGEDPSTHDLEISQRNYCIILNQSFVTVDGLALTKPQNTCLIIGDATSREYNTIQNCTMTYSPNFGWKAGITLNHASNNLITNNTVTNCYVGILVTSYHASASYPTDSNTISHNTVTAIDSSGISLSSGSATAYQLANNIVEYNNVSLCSQTYDDTAGLLMARAGAGNIIRYNSTYTNGLHIDTMRGSGIMLDENSNGNQVYYNLSYGNTSSGISTSGDDTLIYNNTLYNNHRGIFLFLSGITGDSSANSIIKNNIVIATGTQNYATVRTEAVTSGGNVFDNNIYYGSANAHPFSWNSGPPADDHTWEEWRVHNAEAGSLNADPTLVSAGTDFHILPYSPCRNAGVDVGLTVDYEGRPIAGVPDIGAYERRGRFF
uniref:Putative pectate lyase n=1 Tax=viral metagenome TaxID=1070528 RepID=A0A6H1Z6K4_9ZZZZ